MDLTQLPLVVAVGLFAGTVNTVAGGGSLITLPLLIFLGLPPTVANGTNRVGVVVQSFTAASRFRAQGLLDVRRAMWPLVPTLLGALLGAEVSAHLDDEVFRKVIAVALLLMLAVLAVRPKRWLEGRQGTASTLSRYTNPALFLAIGFYGGFLQAGVGVFLLAGLVLLEGHDLLRANGIKVLLVGAFTLPPVVVFALHDQIEWLAGLALAVGSAVGGWLGTHLTVAWGPAFIRWVMMGVVAISATRLLGLW